MDAVKELHPSPLRTIASKRKLAIPAFGAEIRLLRYALSLLRGSTTSTRHREKREDGEEVVGEEKVPSSGAAFGRQAGVRSDGSSPVLAPGPIGDEGSAGTELRGRGVGAR